MIGMTQQSRSESAISSSNGEPAIVAEHVDHFFGQGETSTQVLFDNSLTIDPGEIVIMTGPSGSGKTTLLTLIGAIRHLQAGSLRVLGRELRESIPPNRWRCGWGSASYFSNITCSVH
ncbi:MAG: ATP-binding cassette domain-containing protein [Planctomycetota bacterium]